MRGFLELAPERSDPLHRFTRTELGTDLSVMARKVRFETNHASALQETLRALAQHRATTEPASFRWRVVVQAGAVAPPAWLQMRGYAGPGLRYVSFDQHSYFAVDLEQREAVSFLAIELVRDDLGFSSIFLATLLSMTAAALGLTPLSAACVGTAGRGILVFGPPRSGKTSSAYLAGKLGLQVLGDQNTFVELASHGLTAWGQFWPPAFRLDSEQYLPETRFLTRPFICGDLSFRCLQPHPFQAPRSQSVTPVCCVFLEREAALSPTLLRLSSSELRARLDRSLPFRDDDMFRQQQTAVLRTLGELPAYRLCYASDPEAAAALYPGLLAAHTPLEAKREGVR
jgi:hypothetical protein